MAEKIRQVLKHGTWMYDETVRAEVWIIRQNYFEGPQPPEDEDDDPDYPPTDAEGCFYFPEYLIPGAGGGSGSTVYGTIQEAINKAETTIRGSIKWDTKPKFD